MVVWKLNFPVEADVEDTSWLPPVTGGAAIYSLESQKSLFDFLEFFCIDVRRIEKRSKTMKNVSNIITQRARFL